MKVENDILASVPDNDKERALLLLQIGLAVGRRRREREIRTWTPLRMRSGMRLSLAYKLVEGISGGQTTVVKSLTPPS